MTGAMNKGQSLNMSQLPKLPKRSLIYLLVCISGIIVFFLTGIYPNTTTQQELDSQLRILNNQLDEQKILFPLFKDLMEKTKARIEKQLPFPEKARLPRSEIGKIPSIFKETAQKSNLVFIGGVPDVNTLNEDSELLLVNVSAKGDFFDCRNFLVRLGELPFLEKTEALEINAGRKLKEIKLKVWITLN